MEIEDTISIEKVEKYLKLTAKARKKASSLANNAEDQKKLDSMLRMCDDYYSDAQHFVTTGKFVDAFAAINYAHAWIDAAVRIGLRDGHDDDILFTLP
jgi:hypothetical protein